MRVVPPLRLGVAVLSAGLLLSACSSGSGDDDGKNADSASASAAASGGSTCAADKLDATVGAVNAAPGVGDSGNVTFTVTNTGAQCTLSGFPEVELKGGSSSLAVPKDPAAEAQTLTLPAQGTASFTVTYTRGDGDKAVAATKVAVGAKELDWTYGSVVLKDAGTPDATVSGYQQAGD